MYLWKDCVVYKDNKKKPVPSISSTGFRWISRKQKVVHIDEWRLFLKNMTCILFLLWLYCQMLQLEIHGIEGKCMLLLCLWSFGLKAVAHDSKNAKLLETQGVVNFQECKRRFWVFQSHSFIMKKSDLRGCLLDWLQILASSGYNSRFDCSKMS